MQIIKVIINFYIDQTDEGDTHDQQQTLQLHEVGPANLSVFCVYEGLLSGLGVFESW